MMIWLSFIPDFFNWGNTWLPGPSEQLKDMHVQLDFLKKEMHRIQQKMRTFEKIAADAHFPLDPVAAGSGNDSSQQDESRT